ncbi:GcrA family cell cycle regulator [Novosphingobium sp. PASSN1]|uniref:GcrA family cell cycle regulator n=1 Tax=Novosphingobium sp. PASSN1 TaxID=2015561 RepID=UPI000BCBB878|nr:GcrA family cell cycle regulator [Novosphingobium sp. PASSN1]OYU37354.1 MAG: GcrA cell cycle regulator [Novosphingobium sp. PASSN1]
MSWTDERIEKLTKMWEGGSTASQIADELGGVSRNAVIGKAHRLGLKARPSPVKPNEKSEAAPTKTPRPVPEPAAPAEPRVAAPRPAPAAPASPPPAPRAPVAPVEAAPAPAAPAPASTAPAAAADAPTPPPQPRIVSVGPGGFLRQGPGDQQAPIPPAPPRRLVPARPSQEVADKTGLLDLNDRICRWPMGHPGEPDFHFCGDKVNPGFPYCVEHCGRAYQAQLPRGHRRPPPPMPFGGPRVR